MAYLFQRDTYNGYKCACCIRHWDDEPKWFDTKEEALEAFPTSTYFQDENGNADPYEITITDGSTAEVIAHGDLDWPRGYDKYQGESTRRWHGHIEGRPFEYIKAKSEYEGLTWSGILETLDERKRNADREQAQKALHEAQAKLAALKS